MKQITNQLETSLGPGTKELALRTGLHSGPTTAGVLRGEKARFQLFGDTGKSSHLKIVLVLLVHNAPKPDDYMHSCLFTFFL